MSDIEKHLRWLRDVSGRTNLEAAVAIEALQAEVATLNVMVTDWIEAFDKQKARAEAAEAEVDRLKGVLEQIQLMTYCDASGKRCVNCVARSALEAKP